MYSRIWETITGKNQEPEVAQANEKPENTDSSYSRLYQGRLKQNNPTSSSQYLSRNSQINMLKTLSFMMGIIHIITRVGADKTYFYDQSNNSDYLYDSSTSAFNQFSTQIKHGICGSDPSILNSEISANYIQIASWNGEYKPKNRASLYRAAGDPTNSTLEECLINLISSFNEMYEEKLRDNFIAEEEANNQRATGVLGAIGGILLIAVLLGTAYCIHKCRRESRNPIIDDNPHDVDKIELKEASSEPNSCRSSSDRSSDDVAISMPSPRM